MSHTIEYFDHCVCLIHMSECERAKHVCTQTLLARVTYTHACGISVTIRFQYLPDLTHIILACEGKQTFEDPQCIFVDPCVEIKDGFINFLYNGDGDLAVRGLPAADFAEIFREIQTRSINRHP